jgi:crotonobetainyl-CoA:carnitine CoA-transferase CaiB-like acyl-CoA transferase
VDIATGMNAHAAVLKALIARGITGRGTGIHVSLLDAMADWMNVPLLFFEGTGRAPERVGLAHPSISPYGAFASCDGALVLISIQNEREWAGFCAGVLNEPDLPKREGWRSNTERVANRATVDAHVATVFARLTRTEAAARLDAAGTAYGFVNGVAEFARHPALRRIEAMTPNGPVRLAAPAARLAGVARPAGRVPALDEHGAAIRAEFAG